MNSLAPVVSTDWLFQNLDDEHVRVVESDLSADDYLAGHIPGAAFWHTLSDVLGPDLSFNTAPEHFAALLQRSGIERDSTVVFASNYPATAASLVWLVSLFGFQWYVLDGGKTKWRAEGRPLCAEPVTSAAVPPNVSGPEAHNRAFRDEIERAQNDPASVIIDVRTPEEYSGEYFVTSPPVEGQLAGHIPGALHLEFQTALNADGTFKTEDELRELYESNGVTPEKTIIPYCTVGGRSAHTWFVLKHLLGYPNVRNYDGSWREWSQCEVPEDEWKRPQNQLEEQPEDANALR